jgi:hypothetical protein
MKKPPYLRPLSIFFLGQKQRHHCFNFEKMHLWRISDLAMSLYDLLCCSTGYMDPEAFNNRLCARALYDYTARQVSQLGILLTYILRSLDPPTKGISYH